MKDLKDTIAAISTPIGAGGIGIIRVSGCNSIPAVERIFLPKKQSNISQAKSHTIHYGYILDNDERIDEVLVTVMRAPKTYTREDVVEINCHGGYITLSKILNLLLRNGVRLADPGEFTLRAFLNGRIDLTKAEAVMDIISAKSEGAMRLAMRQLQGYLNDTINEIEDKIVDMVSLYEAHIDFPEEDLNSDDMNKVISDIEDVIRRLKRLSDSFDYARLMKDGVGVSIIGAPNVGKSSLLNRLILRDRAIVTPVPGTTRDIIEEDLNIRGLPVKIIDTAGIRDTNDIIEQEGIRRTKKAIEMADIVIIVCDISKGIDQNDIFMIDETRDKKTIIAINKVDITGIENAKQKSSKLSGHNICYISATTGFGIEELKGLIFNLAVGCGDIVSSADIIVSNERHKNLIDLALKSLENSLKEINQGSPIDIIILPLRESLLYIGELTGKVISDDTILDRIFNRFCIGK
ncbi:MAG: tRNA uridine-5-carboxymethylaminomethyl(34) synthesis GTPase MnmE [Thermodesulfovibrionales bacterium]